ncbi:MAG: hypothetical protein WCL18_02220 [bacterium]
MRQKTFEEYQESYGIDNVICFGRSRLYRIYKVVLPTISLLAITVFGLIFFYQRLNGGYFAYILLAILIIDTVFFFPVIGKYLDYKMDFIVVIPNSLMMNDQ